MTEFEEIVDTLRQRTEALLQEEIAKKQLEDAASLFVEIRFWENFFVNVLFFRDGIRVMKTVEIADAPHWVVKPYFRQAQIAKERKYYDEGGQTYKEKRKIELKEWADKYGLSLK